MAGLLGGFPIAPYGSDVLPPDAYAGGGPGFPSIIGGLLSDYFKRFMALPGIDGGPAPAAAQPTVPQPGAAAPALSAPINIGTAPIDTLPSVAPADIPAAAKPVQYAPPQAAMPAAGATPDFLTRLTNGIAANPYTLMGLGSGIASGQGIGGGIKNAMAGSQLDMQMRNRNLTGGALLQALVSRGYQPQQAWAIAQSAIADPKIAEALLPQALGLKPPETVEGVIAKRLDQSTQPGAAGAQNLIGAFNDFVRGKAAATKEGEVQGTNAANLPNTTGVADQFLKQIDEVRNDPKLGDALGPVFGRAPAVGGHQADLVNRISQLQSQTMLQGFQQLRGAGRITQAEMFQAASAIARLNRVGTLDGFKQALDDLRSVVVAVRTRAGTLAGGAETPPPAAAQAPAGAKASGTTSSGVGWSVQ